jgi:quercetin dioxygenase-like cupin family protein
MSDGSIYRFDEIDWHVPISEGTDLEAAEKAGKLGAGRKFLTQGDSGFYAQVVRIPPGFTAPPHSHSHAEIFMVLSGTCTMNGEAMTERDMTVVPANSSYGFTAGADGVEFLVVRNGQARYADAPA